MGRILFSIFYPHDQRCRLVKMGVLPLFDKAEFKDFTYFLSRYKGENLTLGLYGKGIDKEVKLIKDHFNAFFEANAAKELNIQLPVNQLFLDFPYNTIHFWEQNPFGPAVLQPEVRDTDRYAASLSMLCLKRLSNQNSWEDSSTLHIFIELLSILSCYAGYEYGINVNSSFNQLIEGLKNRARDKEYLIDKFLELGAGIYREGKSRLDNYFQDISGQVKAPDGLREGRVDDWLDIIKKKRLAPAGVTSQSKLSEGIKELILDVASKIDLSHRGLIQAIAVVSELNNPTR